MSFQWIQACHLIALVCWFAGIFYLPRLFVYHATVADKISHERFLVMERKLYYGIMTPAAVLTILFGVWLVSFKPAEYFHSLWFHIKMAAVLLLIGFHLYSGKLYQQFKHNNTHSHVFYRILNEVPVLLLILIMIMVCVKPTTM